MDPRIEELWYGARDANERMASPQPSPLPFVPTVTTNSSVPFIGGAGFEIVGPVAEDPPLDIYGEPVKEQP